MTAALALRAEPAIDPASLHPAVWRGAQLARGSARTVPTGFERLSAELPGGGWPLGSLTELLLQQNGGGELRALKPALHALGDRRIALLNPPHEPQGLCALEWGLNPDRLMWIRAQKTADALWSAEQILRNGSCGALLFWQDKIRPEALRRLHLAAQTNEGLFFLFRPLAAAVDSSPAPLRVSLVPIAAGVRAGIVKRRGGAMDESIDLLLEAQRRRPSRRKDLAPATAGQPIATPRETDLAELLNFPDDATHRDNRNAPLDRPVPAPSFARRVPADLAG